MSDYSLEIFALDFDVIIPTTSVNLGISRHTGFRLVETKDDGGKIAA